MQNSDLNSIRETQINYPEVFNKSYYIIEREKDGAIKCVHAYGVEPKPGFDYIKVADGKVVLTTDSISAGMYDHQATSPEAVVMFLNDHEKFMAEEIFEREQTTFWSVL